MIIPVSFRLDLILKQTKIRLKFPDQTTVQIVVPSIEKIGQIEGLVKKMIVESLGEFNLYVTPPRRVLVSTKSLWDEDLVPASLIHVSFKNKGTSFIEPFV